MLFSSNFMNFYYVIIYLTPSLANKYAIVISPISDNLYLILTYINEFILYLIINFLGRKFKA